MKVFKKNDYKNLKLKFGVSSLVIMSLRFHNRSNNSILWENPIFLEYCEKN